MRRRTFLRSILQGSAAAAVPFSIPRKLYAIGVPPQRDLLICVPSDAAPSVAEAARSLATATNHPLLSALSDGRPARVVESRHLLNGDVHDLAYNHLIVVGDLHDPLVQAAWQREARPVANGIYIFGMGYLSGDVGYIESDRNPFLHGQAIAIAPYETQTITLTGTSPHGIELAIRAFLDHSLVNGAVAEQGWTRPSTTLLDRDPLGPDFTLPVTAPVHIQNSARIAWMQSGEDEYRGVLADTGVLPQAIWRAKYFAKGDWDGAGSVNSVDHYAAGLHRRAYGNTLWLAQFANAREAAAAAPKIAAAARLSRDGTHWKGEQPPYPWPTAKYAGNQYTAGTLVLTQSEDWVTMLAMQRKIS
jgi:hypothetical protein